MLLTAFIISCVSGIILLGLSMSSQLEFWPPSGKDTWQYRLFWLCFRVMLISLVVVCVLDFNGLGGFRTLYYAFGIPLAIFGFGVALYLTIFLGWKNAHGEPEGLKTTGLYRWSRNPIYVVSLIGMFGLGITINSLYVYVLLGLWAILYVVAPFREEPWLEKQYGNEYLKYKARVPRFIGHAKKENNSGVE